MKNAAQWAVSLSNKWNEHQINNTPAKGEYWLIWLGCMFWD